MATYYVATAGDDDAAGTSVGTAWKTLGKVSSEFNAGTFLPGDSILLNRGDTFSDYLRIRGCSGVSGNHIKIGAYGTGAIPIIDRHLQLNLGPVWRDDVDARADYIQFDDVDFYGVKSGCVIKAHVLTGWEFYNCKIHGARRADNGSGWGGGLQLQLGDIVLDNCEVYDIGGEGVYVGTGSVQPVAATLTMRDCSIHDCFGEGLDLKNDSRNCIIERCTFERNAIIPTGEAEPLYDDRQISAGGQGHQFTDCIVNSDEENGPRGAGKNAYGIALGAYAWDDPTSGLNILWKNCLINSQSAAAAIILSGGGNRISSSTFTDCLVGIKAFWQAGDPHIVEGCAFNNTPVQFDLSGIDPDKIIIITSSPLAPSALTATPVSQTQINLVWRDNSNNETGFKIERSPNGTIWTQIATVGAGVITYNNTGLASETIYYYRVRAYNAVGNSSFTRSASAKTLLFTATFTATVNRYWFKWKIKLTWKTVGAVSVSINQGIGAVELGGSRTFYATSKGTYNYTLTATDSNDSVIQKSVKVIAA